MLATLADGSRYGLDLARSLGGDGLLLASEGTLYPLLARLRKAGMVSTIWQESAEGPPRRYYELTSSGREALDTFVGVWPRFRNAVDDIVETGGTP